MPFPSALTRSGMQNDPNDPNDRSEFEHNWLNLLHLNIYISLVV